MSEATADADTLELDERWEANAVSLRVRLDPADMAKEPTMVLVGAAGGGVVLAMATAAVLLFAPAAPFAMGALALSGLGLFVSIPVGLVASSRYSRRKLPVHIDPEAIAIGPERWATEDIERVTLDDGVLTIHPREGEPWSSLRFAAKDPERLLALIQSALPTDEEIEAHDDLEQRMTRKLAALRAQSSATSA